MFASPLKVVENLQSARWPPYRQFLNRSGGSDSDIQASGALPHESICRKMIANDCSAARFDDRPRTDCRPITLDSPQGDIYAVVFSWKTIQE